ncbi:MAG: type IV pilin N-terminal domain-containing protein [Methanoregula sp.]|nr:type IV pilin N-terminal domain-containing protein [Methanoregula sp.]
MSRCSAVSEVFGVMLILAITIIVAGIIAAFATGFSFDSSADSIRANIICSEFDTGDSGAWLIFDHLSGDPVNLDRIEISLGSRLSSHNRTIISNRLTPTGADETGASLKKYILGYGDDSSRVGVGDRFILYADGRDSDGNVYWQSASSPDRFDVGPDDYLTYQIVDSQSQSLISSGAIAVPKN